ncbi:ADP/ATP-dependent (S)-NAD(P)H-hydrate dehydratase, partial [Microbacterium sp. NPDC097977]|uniref:ADP-dependent NAD(P)H-hydrate dehydratase n=1 Tax=Microbacterium sp. NPDC097977 TaxID=3155686 RepID=UPI00332DD001
LRALLDGSVPVVVDAGALDLAPGRRAPLLLTPHGGEFARLARQLGAEPGDDRAVGARRVAQELGATVLLKGARTIIADPDGTLITVEAGTGWLATAGTGDVLGGVLGTLLAANSGTDASIAEIAAAGAWLHGHAGRLAAGVGADGEAHGHPIVALDVAEALPRAIVDVLA